MDTIRVDGTQYKKTGKLYRYISASTVEAMDNTAIEGHMHIIKWLH
jgi:hypothetical protein